MKRSDGMQGGTAGGSGGGCRAGSSAGESGAIPTGGRCGASALRAGAHGEANGSNWIWSIGRSGSSWR